MNKQVIRFTASWCGPCKMLAPVMDELKQQEGEGVIWDVVDIDNAPEAALAYEVRAVPTVLFVDGDTVINKLVGLNPKPEYISALQELKNA